MSGMSGIPTQHHQVWKNGDARVFYLPYNYHAPMAIESWSYWNIDPGRLQAFFYNYWHLSIVIALSYVIAIYSLQKWMRDRPAYSLKWQLVAWNGALSACSALATWRLSEEFRYALVEHGFSDSVCLAVDPVGPAAVWSALFVVSKVAELVDTAFIVLRKRPLLFLHWYHHAVVLIYSWQSTRDMTAAGRWFIFMNYAVHTVMYFYYCIVSAGWRFPKAVSMVVTSLQTAQMLVGIVISVCVAYIRVRYPQEVCQQSDDNLVLCFLIYLSFAVLFIRFFFHAYLRSGQRHAKREIATRSTISNGLLPSNGTESHNNVEWSRERTINGGTNERKKEI